jgi:hypothetical protein
VSGRVSGLSISLPHRLHFGVGQTHAACTSHNELNFGIHSENWFETVLIMTMMIMMVMMNILFMKHYFINKLKTSNAQNRSDLK